jgi:hypothetical protein
VEEVDKEPALKALAATPLGFKGNSTEIERLLAKNLVDTYAIGQELAAMLQAVKTERALMLQSLKAESDGFKTAFTEIKTFIESQKDEMEITVSAGVRKINEATTENAKTIGEQLESTRRANATQFGNDAKTFYDKNTAQSLEAINQANIRAKNDIETRRNQLVGSINTEFLGTQVRGWFVIWSLMATITLGIVLYASHKYLNDTIRDEIWQATAQFSKTKH